MSEPDDRRSKTADAASAQLTLKEDMSADRGKGLKAGEKDIHSAQTQVMSQPPLSSDTRTAHPTIPMPATEAATEPEDASESENRAGSDNPLLYEASEPHPVSGGAVAPLGNDTVVSTIGPYRISRRLGVGGMAEVFLAEQTGPANFRKQVVVKRILPHLHFHAENVELFLREARTAARLSHPNVVQIFELGEENSGYYLAMEYVDGLNTYDLMRYAWGKGEAVPVEVVVQIIADAARGLHHAHELRGDDNEPLELVHRDISPDNLMLSRDGMTKVLDFGIAKGAHTPTLTRTGELKGKIPYMSPEQIRCEPLDRRSDLYSLGVILYWMLTGKRPFVGKSEFVIMNAIIHDEPVAPREKNSSLPKSLDEVVLRLLAKTPDSRFANGLQLAETLEKLFPASREKAAAFAQKMIRRRDEGGPQRAQSLPGFPAAILDSSGQVKSAGEEKEDAVAVPLAPPIELKNSGFQAQTVVLRGTVARREQETNQAKRQNAVWLLASFALVASGLVTWLVFSPTEQVTQAVVEPDALQVEALAQPSPEALNEGPGQPLPSAMSASEKPGSSPTSKADSLSVAPAPKENREPATPQKTKPQKSKRARKEPAKRKQAAQRLSAARNEISVARKPVRTKAPRRIEWRSRNNQVLGRGTGTLQLPDKANTLIAYDRRRGTKTVLPIRGNAVDYADAPRGRLDVRLFPYGDVYLGKERLGTTPFAPVELVVGKYRLRIVYQGKEREESITIREGKSTRVKLNLMKP